MRMIKLVSLALVAAPALALADEAKAPAPRQAPVPAATRPGNAAGAAAVVAPPPKTPPPMPEMKPAPEVAEAAKAMSGSYKCKGNVMNPDGSSKPSLGSLKISADMDGYYLLVDLAQQKTKENPTPFKAHMFRTYDPSSKTWSMVMIATAPGAPIVATTTDAMSGPVTWTSTGAMMGQKFTEKSHEEFDAKSKSLHMWGEYSMDGGKTFLKDYDTTCKK